jgi:hypothetical protein
MRVTRTPVSPATRVTGHVVVINDARGGYLMHAADCTDVPRVMRQHGLSSHYLWDDVTIGGTLGDYAEAAFGDIASDNYEEGTPEWRAETWMCLQPDLRVLPCAARHLAG